MIPHPHLDEHQKPVPIHHPHTPSPLSAWTDPASVATVVPGGPLPPELNGIPLSPWKEAPEERSGWISVAGSESFDEPPFDPKGLKPASGAVVVEPDGRVWGPGADHG